MPQLFQIIEEFAFFIFASPEFLKLHNKINIF